MFFCRQIVSFPFRFSFLFPSQCLTNFDSIGSCDALATVDGECRDALLCVGFM